MNFIRQNIKIFYLLFLPVYFYIAQNSLLNRHTHFYANGIVITHSHPIEHKEGKPINQHNHSKTEICFFHCLQIDYFKNTPEFALEYKPVIQQADFLNCIFLDDYSCPLFHLIPRGPPAWMI